MRVFAIDPGDVQSAYVLMNTSGILEKGIVDNYDLRDIIAQESFPVIAIEMIASYGMPVGKTVFETCVWIGRFMELAAHKAEIILVYRRDVKLYLCNSTRAKDSNVRQALIDRFGKPGTKKEPGMLYGVKKDIWAALAVGVYFLEEVKKMEVK